jgi:hypothetical protein
MFKTYNFVFVVIIFFFSNLSTVLSGPLNEFPEEQKQKWVTRLTEPLEHFISEIEKNKSALKSINDKLAIGLNTEVLKYDEEIKAWIRVPQQEGPFVTKPSHCETDFLNPLLVSFKKILSHGKHFMSSKAIVSPKDFEELEGFYWPFAYADAWRDPSFSDALSQEIETWKNGEGQKLTSSIITAFALSDDLTTLISHYSQLDAFLESFRSQKRADINIITLGCGGDAKQQVYPWVFTFAKQHPTLKVTIDLFDKWENGKPEFLEEYKLPWINQTESNYFFENIEVNIRTFMPLTNESPHGPGFFVNDFHNVLSNLIRKQLKDTVVIISQHMGDYALDSSLVTLYNQINEESSDLKKKFFLVTHQGGLSPRACVFNMKFCNAKIGPEDNFEDSKKGSKEEDIETELQEDELESRLKQVNWLAPKVYQVMQDDKKWNEKDSKEFSPMDLFLKEFNEYSKSYQDWNKDRMNPLTTEGYLQEKAKFEGAHLSTLEKAWVTHLFSKD